MALMVLLRLGLGCHFFYEGVWKITHPEFSAESFLTMAKGPAAWIFHGMIYDIDGRERLRIERGVAAEKLLADWRKVREDSLKRLVDPYVKRLKKYDEKAQKLEEKNQTLIPADQATVASLERKIRTLTDQFDLATEPILWKAEDRLEDFLKKNKTSILSHFAAPSEERKSPEKVAAWLAEISQIETEYLEAMTAYGQENKEAADGINRSARALASKPVFGEGASADGLVTGNRLKSPSKREVLSVSDLIDAEKFYGPCRELKEATVRKFGLNADQQAEAEKLYRRYKDAFKTVLADNRDDIAVHFDALERFEKREAVGNNGAEHQKARRYDRKQELRKEVNVWLNGLEASKRGFQKGLAGILTEPQAARGSLPVPWTRVDLINLAVTYGLTAIGLCLLLGLFTRPAALGGGCFMISVVLTQPAWPTIYPHDPPVVGHALLINKDFIEMLALFMLATTAVGRWAGLDYFVENYVIHLWNKMANKK
ncbi:MAG: DoxX family protein [Pirellulales bacterium]|nr:DoxX family protein [Pirellulales bacterium]